MCAGHNIGKVGLEFRAGGAFTLAPIPGHNIGTRAHPHTLPPPHKPSLSILLMLEIRGEGGI